jgi:hypothetical protein
VAFSDFELARARSFSLGDFFGSLIFLLLWILRIYDVWIYLEVVLLDDQMMKMKKTQKLNK